MGEADFQGSLPSGGGVGLATFAPPLSSPQVLAVTG